MALFNFNKPAANDNDNNADNNSSEKLPVVIQLNEDALTIDADKAAGLTVSELFAQFGVDLGDVDRINRFIAAGQIVSADEPVVLGTVYRGSVTSESKGIACFYYTKKPIVSATSLVVLGTIYRGAVASECHGAN
jgi:hypothetical protein